MDDNNKLNFQFPKGRDEYGVSVKDRLDTAFDYADRSEWHIHKLVNLTWGAVTPQAMPPELLDKLLEVQASLLRAKRLLNGVIELIDEGGEE